MTRLAGAALALLLAFTMPTPAQAADDNRVLVADPYLELHTGPGRGYPVFHVAERHEWVTIEGRRTDWYKVRTENGKLGWVSRAQLEATLTDAGSTRTFRDVVVDDYLARKVEFGVSWGRFKAEPMLKVWGNWRYAEGLGAEFTLGQVQGTFSGTEFWHLNLTAEPWSDHRLSPYLAVGLGNFKNIPNASLVQAIPTDAKLGNASVGLRWYLSERFVARADWTLYSAFVSDTRSLEYRAWTLGLSFFF
jgi:SH3-like domain-containing protein